MSARFAWAPGLVLGLLLGLSLPAAAAQATDPAQPLEQQLDGRYQELQALRAMERRAYRAQAAAQALESDSQGLSEQALALQARAEVLRTRLQELAQGSACVQALPKAQQGLNARLSAWQEALQASQAAVLAVAAATPKALAKAGRLADQDFDRRQGAEQALAQARESMAAALSQCRSQLAQSDGDVQDLLSSSRRLRERALALADAAQALQLETQAQLRLPQAWPPTGGLNDMRQALRAQPLPDRLGLLAADGSGLAELNRQLQGLAQLQSLLSRLQDAAAYARLAAAATGQGGKETQAAQAEMQALDKRSQRAQQDLTQVLQAMQAFVQGLAALPPRLLQAQQVLAEQLQVLGDKLAVAEPQALQTGTQARLLLQPLLASVQEARARAQQAWESAYLARYGHPPAEGVAVGAAPPPSPAPPAPGPTAAMQPPNLAGHAYQFFKELGAEKPGFGAYSYVLLHSGSDLLKPDVAKRYAHVLAVLQREREASTVAASEAAQVNLFCLPGSASSYADELGKQILFRAQSGLLTRPEMKKRLGPKGGSGPFLITLPLRLSEARSSTPLLFVDLSLYPEDTVADLLGSYMGDLLRDFPREQLRWKPPLLQQVALTMIGLSGDVSGLFMSVLPTASAAEAKSRP